MNQNKLEYVSLFKEMIQKIKDKINLNAFILFGSRARGEAHINSDYDLVIIADFKEKYILRSDWILEFTPFIPLDIFCYTPEEFNSLFENYNITAIDAIGEGIILFGLDYVKPYIKKYKELLQRGLKKEKCILIPPAI